MSSFERFLMRHFPYKVAEGADGPYLRRWTLAEWRGRAVYLHHFIGDDTNTDLHDHSRRFVSVGVKGAYIEHTAQGARVWRAPWVRTFPATHAHRLTLATPSAWTLVGVGRMERRSGFLVKNKHIRAGAYRLSQLLQHSERVKARRHAAQGDTACDTTPTSRSA